jgi:hypothetical protein
MSLPDDLFVNICPISQTGVKFQIKSLICKDSKEKEVPYFRFSDFAFH